MHSSDHAAIESSVGKMRFAGRDEDREALVGLFELGPDLRNGPGSRETKPMTRRTSVREAMTTSSVPTSAAPDRPRNEPAVEAERAEHDEHDDADEIGDALGDDDGRGLRHRARRASRRARAT